MVNKLRYDKLVDYYVNLFGKENVLVLPFEKISNKSEFLGSLYSFISVGELEHPVCKDITYNKSHHHCISF